MLSRVAEGLYWMARYLERAENTARIINVNSHLLLDLPKRVQLGWRPIIEILGVSDSFSSLHDTADPRSAVRFLVGEPINVASILSCLNRSRENARTIRDIIPRKAWEQINSLYLEAKSDFQGGAWRNRLYDYLGRIILGSQTVSGLFDGAMTHGQGYNFLIMGRSLERADMTTRIIDVRSANLLPETNEALLPFENIQWMSVLRSLSAYQMYRHEVHVRVRGPAVLNFLFLNERFPRSFLFSIQSVAACLRDLPPDDGPVKALEAVRQQLIEGNPGSLNQAQLHQFIDELQVGLAKVDNAITDAYFAGRHTRPKMAAAQQ